MLPAQVPTPLRPAAAELRDLQRIDSDFAPLVRYYSEAGPDYRAWSRRFNMHFGYFRWGVNPFRLESMLDQMNREVLQRLRIAAEQSSQLFDMGCGLGTTARYAARQSPNWLVSGVTIVPWQIEEARRMTADAALDAQVAFLQADYRSTPFADATFDGGYAIESTCYAEGLSKETVIREAARVLKPGARMVFADGFLKRGRRMNPLLDWCYRTICRCWSLDTFADIREFTTCLNNSGFDEVEVEEISWRIAPSVLYVPWVTLRFLVSELFSSQPMTRERWNNVIAPCLGMVVGLARLKYGYYLVTARKK